MEIVLLTVVFMSLVAIVSRTFNANQYFVELVQSPWTNRLAGMIENGVWGNVKETKAFHPNLLDRHASIVGEEVP